MAIRETWNRMVRKSFSSSSSGARSDDGHDSPTAGTTGTSPTPSVPAPVSKSSRLGGLSKISSWRSHGSHNGRHHHSGGSDGSDGKVSGGGGDSSSRKASPKRDSPPKSILKKSGGGGGGFSSGFPRRVHPSERPLTEQNLRHQEMLGTFTMKFGRSRRFSRGARSSFSGISPRCSIDSSAGPPGGWGDDDCAGCGPGYHRRTSSAAVAPDEARIAEESS